MIRKFFVILAFFVSVAFSNPTISKATELILNISDRHTTHEANHIASVIYENAVANDLEYSYVLAIVMTESRFNDKATSYRGAKGLMQIMPSTFKSIAKKNNLNYSNSDMYNIEKNVTIGCLYLRYLSNENSNMDFISAGYNGGLKAARNYIAGNYTIVPYQTLSYVKTVNKYYRNFSETLNS